LVQLSNPVAARNKYGFGREARKQPVVEIVDELPSTLSEVEVKRRPIIKHGDFEFHECPVPSLVDNLMTEEDRLANFLINMVNWSEASHQLPAEGPLLDQSSLFYEARLIVLSEQNKIEVERQEEQAKKSKTKNQGTQQKSLGKGK
jgi:hypothetical protein